MVQFNIQNTDYGTPVGRVVRVEPPCCRDFYVGQTFRIKRNRKKDIWPVRVRVKDVKNERYRMYLRNRLFDQLEWYCDKPLSLYEITMALAPHKAAVIYKPNG